MAAPLALRLDFNASELRRYARQTRNANQARRLLALAMIYDGGSRGQAARIGGVGLQIVRDWVIRFNADGLDGLIDRKAPGPMARLNQDQLHMLEAMVENGPVPAVHGVVRWRLMDLTRWIWEEWSIVVSPQTLSRELRSLGFRKLSARPRHHAQAAGAVDDFKKTSQPAWVKLPSKRISRRAA
jgi:transposase